jgi:DNA-binding response OmpR family regulator
MTASSARVGRILIVDNDLDRLDSTQTLLESTGYRVFSAETLAKARELLTRERVHVALLDIRMEADADPADTSGLKFATEVDPVVAKIIVTAYPSFEAAIQALGPVGGMHAVDFILKQQGPEALLAAVERAFRERLRINFDLHIHWHVGLTLDQAADEIELRDYTLQVIGNEVEETLSRLFYAASEIMVSPLMPGYRSHMISGSGAALLKVEPHYPDRGWGFPSVVKLAPRDKILTEVHNYEQYVEGLIAGFRHTKLEHQVQTHLLGGIVYTLVGTPFEECTDLATFYAEHSAKEVIQVLKRLFLETCGPWYADRKPRQVHDLVELYAKPLKLSAEKLEAGLQEAGLSCGTGEEAARCEIPGLKGTFLNPVEWWRRHPELPALSWQCNTHGDLHSRNVLVDRHGQGWLIDFYRTGPGHLFRDLIELECDLKFVLLETTDLSSLLRFERALLSASEFGDRPTLPSFREAELKKAFVVVLGIRQIASELAGPGADMLNYYQGLLLQTLNMIRLRHVLPLKKQHAFLAASGLCQRLEEW